MNTEYGIFSDESESHASIDAIESQMYSKEEAELRLAEMRAEAVAAGTMEVGEDDGMYVHEVEEPEEEEDDDEDEEDDDEYLACENCDGVSLTYTRRCANGAIYTCNECQHETLGPDHLEEDEE
jgi:hypothetical protein